jgi:hypothetical protein
MTEDTSLFVAVIFEVYLQAVKLSSKSSYQAKPRLYSHDHVTILSMISGSRSIGCEDIYLP